MGASRTHHAEPGFPKPHALGEVRPVSVTKEPCRIGRQSACAAHPPPGSKGLDTVGRNNEITFVLRARGQHHIESIWPPKRHPRPPLYSPREVPLVREDHEPFTIAVQIKDPHLEIAIGREVQLRAVALADDSAGPRRDLEVQTLVGKAHPPKPLGG